MGIRFREIRGVSLVEIDGNIDINSSDIIETVGWLVNNGKINIILDLKNVNLADYSGINVLTIAYKNAVNHCGMLKFVHVGLPIIELMKVMRLDVVFEIFTDEEDALQSFFTVGSCHPLRRKFARLDVHFTVSYWMSDADETRRTFEGSVLNMSAAGLYIYSTHLFPVQTRLDLSVKLPKPFSAIDTEGRVVWHADKEMQFHSYPGMGVSFTHLTPGQERTVADFVEKNISHRAEPV